MLKRAGTDQQLRYVRGYHVKRKVHLSNTSLDRLLLQDGEADPGTRVPPSQGQRQPSPPPSYLHST